MANITENMTVVSKEIEYTFESTCLSYKTFNTQYDKQYEAYGAAAGDTINVKQPHRAIVTDGRSMASVPDDEERIVALPRATHKKTALNFTADDMAHDLTKAEQAKEFFGRTRLAANVQALAAVVDSTTYANVIPQVYNYTRGAETTDPSSYADVGVVKAKLDDYHAHDMDRSFILTNNAMVSLNAGMSGFFNPTTEKSADYRSGELRPFNGFMFYNSTYLPRHTNGSAATGGVKTTLSGEGVNTMVVDSLGTDTILAGDRFVIADVFRKDLITKEDTGDLQDFVVLTASGTVAGESTITFSPAIETLNDKPYSNVDSFPQAGAVVTFAGKRGESQSLNVAYHKDAFVLAFVDLPKINCTYESYIRDSDTGLSMKITGQGDIMELKSVFRLDVLFGSVAVNPWWAVVVYGA